MCPSLTQGLKFLKTVRPLHLYPPKRPKAPAHYIKRQGRKKFWGKVGVRISRKETPQWVWGSVVPGLISFERVHVGAARAFLPFLEESGVELAGSRGTKHLPGGSRSHHCERKRGHSEGGARRGWEPRSHHTLRPSLLERIGEESPAIQNSRQTSCPRRFFLLVKGIRLLLPGGLTSLADRRGGPLFSCP